VRADDPVRAGPQGLSPSDHEADLEAPLAFYGAARALGDFDTAIRDALPAILASPKFLYLEARDRDPEVAMAMVDSMAKVFGEDRDQWNQQQDKRDRIEVKMLDSVYNLGYEQYSPQTKINTLAGGLFGALIGFLVIFFLEWLEMDVIRNSEDVERAIDVTVLGAIPPVAGAASLEAKPKRRQLVPGLRGTN
jgi:hypothetical protein